MRLYEMEHDAKFREIPEKELRKIIDDLHDEIAETFTKWMDNRSQEIERLVTAACDLGVQIKETVNAHINCTILLQKIVQRMSRSDNRQAKESLHTVDNEVFRGEMVLEDFRNWVDKNDRSSDLVEGYLKDLIAKMGQQVDGVLGYGRSRKV